MKVFYDKDGNIMGAIEGASKTWEENIKHPIYDEATVPKETEEKIKNPDIPLGVYDLEIRNGGVVEPNKTVD